MPSYLPTLSMSQFPFKVFAVPLEDSSLYELRNSNGETQIIFKWDGFLGDSRRTKGGLTIAVTRHEPYLESAKIEEKTNNLFALKGINSYDIVLGIRENREADIGVVYDVVRGERNFPSSVTVTWKQENIQLPEKIHTKEIQKFNPDYVPELSFVFEEHYLRYQELFNDKQKAYTRQPGYIGESESLKTRPQLEDKEEAGGRVKLFFGTNRNQIGEDSGNDRFGKEKAGLTVGTCEITIPRDHVQGAIERPGRILWINLSESERKHVTLANVKEIDPAAFFPALSTIVGAEDPSSALVFIHGYNMTFAEAARRTGQIVYDLPFYGLGGFFSWPSSGTAAAYPRDIEVADASVPVLQEFVERLIVESGISKLHLIAHSMGNRLLGFTLKELSAKSSLANYIRKIQEIVLAAPDLDQDVFRKLILPAFKTVGNNRTLYASENDQALIISEQIRGGLSRLGQTGAELFTEPGIDTIDASNVRSTGNHHSYVFETDQVLSDLHTLITTGFGPQKRRLRARRKNDLIYWLFPLTN